MATYSGNDDYLSIDGTSMGAYLYEVEIVPSMETADTTAGSGTTHRTRNAGLKDFTLSLTIVYDDAQHATIFPLIKPGAHTVIYGPQGNTAGEPKHEQSFIFTEAGFGGNMEKGEKRVFSISAEAAAAPVSNMYDGATW